MVFFALTACSTSQVEEQYPSPTPRIAPPATLTPFQPILVTSTASPLPIPTQTDIVTPTPNPYQKYTISAMRSRTYGDGGAIQIIEKLEENKFFTRYKICYPSDGLMIYGFINVPKGTGPFPVIIVIHGNYNTKGYQLMPYSTNDADLLSRKGYFVFHPNMRNYGESDQGDDFYRSGLTIDILNLISLIKSQGSLAVGFEKADGNKIGIWAHSMGGEVALRVLTISNDILATVLYAPMTGDIIKNAQYIDNQEELNTPAYLIPAISPLYSYYNITSALQLFHGTADDVVPVAYSEETCLLLTNFGKEINCTFYDGARHTFNSNYTSDFEKRFLYFYETNFSEP